MSDKHQNFNKYMKYIVEHPNYSTQPCRYNDKGEITWVKASGKDREDRVKWWDSKIKEFNVNNRADVARLLHPKDLNGFKPCSECGKNLSIYYVYPGKNLVKYINIEFKQEYILYGIDVYSIIDDLISRKIAFTDIINFFKFRLKIKEKINSIEELKDYLYNNHTHITQKGKMFSPGVMANPPDRFDGFHTYNGCCRKEKDTGRHDDNMKSYTRDRRAFENWSDGNFTLANTIMGEYGKYLTPVLCPGCNTNQIMTADHIGPISLGFCHRKEFNPLCSSCNSQKNNNMTLLDVLQLIDDENNGLQVISWHSSYLWNKLKHKIISNENAKIASSIMRENIHYILTLFNIINKDDYGHQYLMNKLNPEYVKFKYKINNFNPLVQLKDSDIHESISTAKTKVKSEKRYIEICFESLQDYDEKDNRIYNNTIMDNYKSELHMLNLCLSNNESFNDIDKVVYLILDSIAKELDKKFDSSVD